MRGSGRHKVIIGGAGAARKAVDEVRRAIHTGGVGDDAYGDVLAAAVFYQA